MSNKALAVLAKIVLYGVILVVPTSFVYSAVHGYVAYLTQGAFLAEFTQFLLVSCLRETLYYSRCFGTLPHAYRTPQETVDADG